MIIFFYNIQSVHIQRFTLESTRLLTEWSKLENKTNSILLNRYTHSGKKTSPLLKEWEQDYRNFASSLENLMNNRQIEKWEGIRSRSDGALRVWRFTEVRLNTAKEYFFRIIQTGLGEKIMVNGFIHTMYQLRIDGQLNSNEIFLLEDTIYALESLDNATREFDILFTGIVNDMEAAGEKYLKRIRLLSVGVLGTVLVILIIMILINHQLGIAGNQRQIYQVSRKNQLMKGLCENSCEENILHFRKEREELGVQLLLDQPFLMVMIQIDNYSEFSHKYNIGEQRELITATNRNLSIFLGRKDLKPSWFKYTDDTHVFLFNLSDSYQFESIKVLMNSWLKESRKQLLYSFTLTLSDPCFDQNDLDQDFRDLILLSEYRFLLGRGTFITGGSAMLHPGSQFHYPMGKQQLFEASFKSLDQEQTLRVMDEMLRYTEPYGPQSMKRMLLRLTANIGLVVDLLERNYHITTLTGITAKILEIQQQETLTEVKSLLDEIIKTVISVCYCKKEEKHDQNIINIKTIIETELTDFNLSADLIAVRIGLSSSYINRLFKQHTSLSIAGYINMVRLETARQLLQDSSITVADTAMAAGFASIGTFFRLFKKKYGHTPGDYQRERSLSKESFQ